MLKIMEKIKAKEPVKIVFFGDSVTQGCFEDTNQPGVSVMDAQAVYHNRLAGMLAEAYPGAQLEIINAGVGGDYAGMGLFRIQKDVLDKNADLCVVCFGLNDSLYTLLEPKFGEAGQAIAGMLSMVEPLSDAKSFTLLKEGKPQEAYRYALGQIFGQLKSKGLEVVFMTPNMMNTKPTSNPMSALSAAVMTSGSMDEMMQIARDTALEYGIPVVDCYKKWKDLEKSGTDTNAMLVNGVNHPIREAHRIFAEALYEKIVE